MILVTISPGRPGTARAEGSPRRTRGPWSKCKSCPTKHGTRWSTHLPRLGSQGTVGNPGDPGPRGEPGPPGPQVGEMIDFSIGNNLLQWWLFSLLWYRATEEGRDSATPGREDRRYGSPFADHQLGHLSHLKSEVTVFSAGRQRTTREKRTQGGQRGVWRQRRTWRARNPGRAGKNFFFCCF